MVFGNKNKDMKIKMDIETQIKALANAMTYNNFVMKLNGLKLKSELHNEIANRLWDRCNGDKSTLTAYMNFIYRLKTLQDDVKLYMEYIEMPKEIGVLDHTQEKDRIRMQFDENESFPPGYSDEPNLIRMRLERYNDYLYFDDLTEESFKNGYYVEYQDDYIWKEDDIPYQDKYKELIKCILNLLKYTECLIFSYDVIPDRFPKLVKLIERNKKVCQDKLKELENKQE